MVAAVADVEVTRDDAILTVTLFVPVVGGLYVPGAGPREGMASILTGVFVLGVTHVLTSGQGYGVLSPALAGVLASAVAFAFALATFMRPKT